MSQRLAGAIFIALLGGSIAVALSTSGRTLGAGRRFDVEFHAAGALKEGARLRIAGREAGEVRALRWERLPDGSRDVVAECFVAADWAQHLHINSEYFIATPSVLGEAYLEVGPPRAPRGQPVPAPGRALSDGERVRGVDPPELDRLISRLFGNLTVIAVMFREDRPDFDALLAAGDQLLTTVSGLEATPGQLTRVRRQIAEAYDDSLALYHDLDDVEALPRMRAIAHDLSEVTRRAVPEMTAIGKKAAAVIERVDGLSDLWSPARRQRVARGAAALERAVAVGVAVAAQVGALAALVERGEGSVGAFVHDRELFDDLHEVHRILKSQPWTLIVKPERGQKTVVH